MSRAKRSPGKIPPSKVPQSVHELFTRGAEAIETYKREHPDHCTECDGSGYHVSDCPRADTAARVEAAADNRLRDAVADMAAGRGPKASDVGEAPVFQGFKLVQTGVAPAVKMRTPQTIAEFMHGRIGTSAVERFWVIGLSPAATMLGAAEVCVGGYSDCAVDPRVLFTSLLAMGPVSGFVISHNHPSGDTQPSAADLQLTKQLKDAGRLLCLRLLDHVIVCQDPTRFWSMQSNGQI